MSQTDATAANPILAEVQPDEQVVWSGKPRKRAFLFATPSWVSYFLPFFLLWVLNGIALLVFLAVKVGDQEASTMVFLVVYTLIGLYLGFGRYLFALWEWKNTFYLLTTRRVLVSRGVTKRQIARVPLEQIKGARVLYLRASGVGNIDLGNSTARSYIPGWPTLGMTVGPAFLAVENARALYDKVQELRNAAQNRRP
ncbi:MAG: PH domain-containing protein [Chloroflexi bacterium]|nr:PH domain-containing protein [Chloroflexota bacterium]